MLVVGAALVLAALDLLEYEMVKRFSSSVRNHEFHPIWGFIADHVWLR